jgi:7-cyano-7-deazaguanine synthase
MYIPYRTLLFFTVAAAQAQIRGVTDVVSGFINSNHAKELDCSAKFLNELDELAKGVGVVRFVLPFRDMSKAQVATLARELNVPIGRTFSCQLFSDVPCGACPNCVDRIDGLAAAGLLK